MNRICTICARGGSKGLPGKNLRKLMGKSLIAHAIGQARDTGLFRAIAVSSDDGAILAEGRACGADFVVRRPDEFARDESAKHPAIIHCVEEVERELGDTFDTIVDVDVTSPLRLAADINGTVELMESSGVTNVITGAPARKNPYFNLVERRADGSVGLASPRPVRLQRRQDAPACFDMNAAVYAWQRDAYFTTPDVFYDDTLLYEMPVERSWDIDTSLDFDWVQFLMERRDAS